MLSGISAVLLAISVSTLNTNTGSTQKDHRYWSDSEQREVLFVPSQILESADVELRNLGLPEKSREALLAKGISSKPSPDSTPAGTGACASAVEGDVPAAEGDVPAAEKKAASALPLVLKAVSRNEIAVLGRVTEIVSGWLTPYNYAASSVSVEVVENLTKEDNLMPGRTLRFLQDDGRFVFRGQVLCTEDRTARPARVGDLIVVAGRADRNNSQAVITNKHLVFFVEDDAVRPASGGASVSLDQVRAHAKASRDGKGAS